MVKFDIDDCFDDDDPCNQGTCEIGDICMFNRFGRGYCVPSECQNYLWTQSKRDKVTTRKPKKAVAPKVEFDFNLCFGDGFGSCEEFDGDDNCDIGMVC